MQAGQRDTTRPAFDRRCVHYTSTTGRRMSVTLRGLAALERAMNRASFAVTPPRRRMAGWPSQAFGRRSAARGLR